jgi:hypothetical protein
MKGIGGARPLQPQHIHPQKKLVAADGLIFLFRGAALVTKGDDRSGSRMFPKMRIDGREVVGTAKGITIQRDQDDRLLPGIQARKGKVEAYFTGHPDPPGFAWKLQAGGGGVYPGELEPFHQRVLLGQPLEGLSIVLFFGKGSIFPMVNHHQNQKTGEKFSGVLGEGTERGEERCVFRE